MRKTLVLLCLTPLLAVADTVQVRIYPPAIDLESEGSKQTILVAATDDEGVSREVTQQAELSLGRPESAGMEGNRHLVGRLPGETELTARFEGVEAKVWVRVKPKRERSLSFTNDILPIFTRADCANSGCHGSVRGKKGFKLSLFGTDPAFDYAAITKDADGRRISRNDPADSLVLRKPSFQEPHGGGQRFEVDSTQYNLMLEWLKANAPFDEPGQPRLSSVEVFPHDWRFIGLGSSLQLVVVGRYSDGSVRDLTGTVRFISNVPAIVSAGEDGVIQADTPGETAVMVRTAGFATAVPVRVVKDRPMRDYPEITRNNYIDEHVFRKLRDINIVPSELATDEEFLRRVYFDVIGLPPTLEETAAFLSSNADDKRARLIDELLDRPERADVWAMRFADMFRAGYNEAGQKGGGAVARWFRDRVREDLPYDEMARRLLVSQGRHDFEGISNFYFVSREITPEESGVNVSQLFLGLQIECARCHNHPFENWTQNDFYNFSAFFARISRKDMYLNNHNASYLMEEGEVKHPTTGDAMQPKYLDGAYEPEVPGEDVREKLAEWVTARDNPFFAKATVNRVWKFFMGRGLVEPVDDFRVTNPSTNDELLNALAANFIEGGYSLKLLERQILSSRAYQLSSQPNATNADDEINYSKFIVRRLMSEQLIDGMTQVTGVPEKFPTQPLGVRAMAIPVLPYGKPHYMMKAFGRHELREVICERDAEPSVAQVMHLISGDTLQRQITGRDGNLDAWLADSSLGDEQIVERLYLAALSREPQPDEVEAAVGPLARSGAGSEDRRRTFEDLLWALFNSKEFLFQH